MHTLYFEIVMFDSKKIYQSGISFYSKEIDNYFIDYVPNSLNYLVVTFENADQPKRPRLDGMREPWGLDFLIRRGYSVLGIKPKSVDWYRGADLHAFFRSYSFKIFILSFNRVVLYGSSMGGFAALSFAEVCPDPIVIAFNPQSTLNMELVPWETRYPEGRAQDWTGDFVDGRHGAANAKTVYVAYDPLFDLDRKHVDRLIDTNLVRLKMPLVGHVVMSWMGEAAILPKFIDEALAGTLTEQRCQKLARERRKSKRYYIGMGLRTRSASVALACVRRLLASDIPIHHQNDLKELVIKHRLWNFLAEDQSTKSLIKLNESILFDILKAASDDGFPDTSLKTCSYLIDQHDPDWKILVLAAECQHRLGRLSEGKALARRAIAKNSSVGNCYRILARILYDAGEFSHALEAGEQGVAVDPASFLGWIDLAKYHEALGQLQAALNCATRAREIRPNDQSVATRIEAIVGLIASSPRGFVDPRFGNDSK